MKQTMTNCFLHIAICTVLIFLNVMSLGVGIIGKNWFGVVLFSTFTIQFTWLLVLEYKKCKRIEEQIQRNIQSLMNLQAFDLLRKTLEN